MGNFPLFSALTFDSEKMNVLKSEILIEIQESNYCDAIYSKFLIIYILKWLFDK